MNRTTIQIEQAVEQAKREIVSDAAMLMIPVSDLTCFADLHDHVDANEYCGIEAADLWFANAVIAALDEWIRSGQITRDITAGRY